MRAKRIEYFGAMYHVMQRGNNKEVIFRGEKDKQFFIAELANSKKKFDFQLYGYVLLDNHYHLLMQTGEIPLNKIMQRQNSIYSRYYNRSYERSGHLFGLRYKASIIQDERYLFAVLRYIHWNPVRVGLSGSVSDYKWSSDAYYRSNKTGLVNTSFILNSISKNSKYAVNEYLRLIQDEATEEYDLFVRQRIITVETKDKTKQLDDILLNTGVSMEEYRLIKKGSRQRNLTIYKAVYAQKAIQQGFTLKEIADSLNVSITAIYRASEFKETTQTIS